MAGKPPINAPAPGPSPRLELSLDDRALMTALGNAGRDGLLVGAEIAISAAIRLSLTGVAVIDKATPQRVRLRRFAQ